MRDTINLIAALDHPNVRAFGHVVRAGESNHEESAYTMLYGGNHFVGFQDHPRQAFKSPWGWTSAAGAYQAMCAVPGKVKTDTWGDCVRAIALTDFTPKSQDIFFAWCVNRRGALDDVIAGRLETAIRKCAKEWASLPFSPYGQPVRTLEQCFATFQQYGGTLATEKAMSETSNKVADFVGAALESLFPVVPALIRIFGDSPQAEKNAKAADIVVAAAKEATGARNEQELIEMVGKDPVAAQQAKDAIESRWLEISEVGGGVDAARKADSVAQATGDIRKSPSFWVAILLLPLVYMLVMSLIGLIGTATWSDDVRAGLAGSLISAVIGAICGYYYGQTTSRNRTPTA